MAILRDPFTLTWVTPVYLPRLFLMFINDLSDGMSCQQVIYPDDKTISSLNSKFERFDNDIKKSRPISC